LARCASEARLAGAADSSWQNVLKAQIYVPSAADIPDALDVWQQHVKAPCALTAVPTKGFGFIDSVVEINLLAFRDGARRKKEVLKVDLPAMSSYGTCGAPLQAILSTMKKNGVVCCFGNAAGETFTSSIYPSSCAR
jgi:hypothetical protein